MKKQIIIIHGGDTFKTYKEYISFLKKIKINFTKITSKGWKDTLGEKLGREFEVVLPKMPSSFNARYLEWEIWFKKLAPFFKKSVVLIGHSLGGIFLAKYLSENKFPKNILATFLIAPPYNDKDSDYPLVDFVLKKDLSKLQKQAGKLFIFQSRDDKVVPFVDFGKYKKALPNANFKEFKNRGHFNQRNFPELVREIKIFFKN